MSIEGISPEVRVETDEDLRTTIAMFSDLLEEVYDVPEFIDKVRETKGFASSEETKKFVNASIEKAKKIIDLKNSAIEIENVISDTDDDSNEDEDEIEHEDMDGRNDV